MFSFSSTSSYTPSKKGGTSERKQRELHRQEIDGKFMTVRFTWKYLHIVGMSFISLKAHRRRKRQPNRALIKRFSRDYPSRAFPRALWLYKWSAAGIRRQEKDVIIFVNFHSILEIFVFFSLHTLAAPCIMYVNSWKMFLVLAYAQC